jgi:uncharacterized membrane protein YebE (DUF533 family)
VQQNNPLAIGGLGALAGAMLGGGKGAVGGGLMAVLGSLAYSALQRANQQQQVPGCTFSAGADIGAPGASPRSLTARVPARGKLRARRSSCCRP